jgi:3'-phosphoadenosine 5'-phosphosulfate sulfotransferase (PAPS reductase)/FAD synthetase
VSTSWGKDSVALCDLAIDTVGPIDLVHLQSGYEIPGNESISAHFAARAPVHEVPPPRTVEETIEWIRSIGLCFEREGSTAKVAHRSKGDRASRWGVANGFSVQLMGLRADESVVRRGLISRKGQLYLRRTDGWHIGHPLGWWTVDDSWAWIVSRGLPYHPLYDCETDGQTRRTLRNGGWLTTIGAPDGRLVWLRRHYPDLWRRLTEEFPRTLLVS